ncbi:NAD(FAD)-utilizing dehydrogenase [Kordiimonadales bacterium JCM 17843]|nr:NAD(FAD)-utilizing dehydrogenase [Kordiimonadales bacterium JCM 17843]
MRQWADDLGAETFVGSSGRVFPKAMKASPLLRAWLGRLRALNVEIRTRTEWRGWDESGALLLHSQEGDSIKLRPAATILALGGASWPRLGSDGSWRAPLEHLGVTVSALEPANCGFTIPWCPYISERFAGTPLKTCMFSVDGHAIRGEAIITRTGIEGGAIYALSARLRDQIRQKGQARLTLDLRPDLSHSDLQMRLSRVGRKQSLSNRLRKAAKLSPLAIALVLEHLNKAPRTSSHDEISNLIKCLSFDVTGSQPIDRAISTAGGVSFRNLDDQLMLRASAGIFIAGEMLDWDAPTGGYLLQACLSSGFSAAQAVKNWLNNAS